MNSPSAQPSNQGSGIPPEVERAWIRAAQEGDRQAFSRLVRAYQARILRVVTGFVRNREDALDISQEVFVKAYRSLVRFQGGSSFYTWLYRIAMNACIDHRRRRGVRAAEAFSYEDGREHDEEAFADFPGRSADLAGPARAAMDRELGEVLVRAIADLSEKHREVLLLREVDGLSYEEIAQQVGCHLGTVMSRLFHARKRVQRALAGYRALDGSGGGEGGDDEGA